MSEGYQGDDWLTPQELSAWLKVPLQTIYNWRTRGAGPTAYKVGRSLRYRKDEVTAWVTGGPEETSLPSLPPPQREGPAIARRRAPKRRG